MEKKQTNWRAAIIGCGDIGALMDADPLREGVNTHAKAYSLHPRFELIAGVDSVPKHQEQFTQLWSCPAYDSLEDLLKNHKIEVVSLCTPANTHLEYIQKLAEAGIQFIWCEKPLCYTLQEAQSILELQERYNLSIVVNYFRRFDPVHKEIINTVSSGRLGPLQAVHAKYSKGLHNNGSHIIDFLNWMGLTVTEAQNLSSHPGPEGDPTLDVFFKTKENVPVILQGVNDHNYRLFEIDILGALGRLQFSWGGAIQMWDAQPSARTKNFNELKKADFKYQQTLPRDLTTVLDHFQGHIEKALPIESSVQQAMAVIRVLGLVR